MYNINTTKGYFIHLISCALNDIQPQEIPKNVNFADIFSLAIEQNVANLIWYSIEKLNIQPEKNLFDEWYQVYAKAVVKCTTQQIELEIITGTLAENSIDVVALKGSVIRNYYPIYDMRTMTDLDILVRTKDKDKIRNIMSSLGYTLALADDGQVDAFEKEPIMAVDIHYDLMSENHHYQEHFQNYWDIAIKTEKKGIYAFSFEDMYIYNIGHYAKHMFSGGTGIRCILDAFVLWNAATNEQKQNISQKLEEKKLLKFNNQLIEIGQIWFTGKDDDSSTEKAQEYFLNTSTYGISNEVNTTDFVDDSKGETKAKYYLKRIFPPTSELYRRYSIKHRCFLLLPFLWFFRLITSPLKSKAIVNEVNNIEKIDNEEIQKTKDLFIELGLK